jgi:hypothetical protein
LARFVDGFPPNHKRKHSACVSEFHGMICMKPIHPWWSNLLQAEQSFLCRNGIELLQIQQANRILHGTLISILEILKFSQYLLNADPLWPLELFERHPGRRRSNGINIRLCEIIDNVFNTLPFRCRFHCLVIRQLSLYHCLSFEMLHHPN